MVDILGCVDLGAESVFLNPLLDNDFNLFVARRVLVGVFQHLYVHLPVKLCSHISIYFLDLVYLIVDFI